MTVGDPSRFAGPLLNQPPNVLLDLEDWIGQRSSTFRFSLIDGVTGENRGDLLPRRDTVPSLSHDTSSTIKRQLSLALGAVDTARIDTVRDRVLPYMVLSDGEEFPLGRFMFTGASRFPYTSGRLSNVTLFDEMFLVDQQLEQTFSPPVSYTGTVPVATTTVDVAAGLLLAGLPIDYVIAPTPFWTVGSWSAGTNRGSVLEDLSVEGDYFSPWFDHGGVMRMIRTFDPVDRVPDFDLDSRSRVVRGGIVESDDLLTAPNRWVVISNGTASESEASAPIVGVYDVPASAPHSIANRGFVIPEVIDRQIDTQLQANAVAAGIGQRQTMFETVELSTPPDPRHDSYQVVTWQGVRWLEIGWSMALVEGGQMRHTLRKAYAS